MTGPASELCSTAGATDAEERFAFELTGTPEAPCSRPDKTGGWGLLLVDRIADRWAVTPTATGTCVWCEIRYDA